MSGRSARSIRNFSLELWQDLVLPNVGQVDFYAFRTHWNLNVLEMALKTFRFVQGLPITPLFFVLRYFKTTFSKLFVLIENLEIWESQSLEKTRAEKYSISVWSKVFQLPWCVD